MYTCIFLSVYYVSTYLPSYLPSYLPIQLSGDLLHKSKERESLTLYFLNKDGEVSAGLIISFQAFRCSGALYWKVDRLIISPTKLIA